MAEFLAGLALLIIGGLATIAVRYPKGYGRMFYPLLGLSFFVALGTLTYSLGYSQGGMDLYPYLDRARLDEAFAASDSDKPPFDWIVGGAIAFMLYLILLAGLPAILGISEDGDEKGDSENKG